MKEVILIVKLTVADNVSANGLRKEIDLVVTELDLDDDPKVWVIDTSEVEDD